MTNEVRVWDPLVRIFHWSLVISFTIGYLTGDEESSLHVYAGYTVLGLICFRVLWGLIGTRYARFSDFVYSPAKVIDHVKGLFSSNPRRYLGHNPVGGWMVITMLATLFVVTISGLKVYALEEGLGPLAGDAVEIRLVSVARANDDNHEYRDDKDDEDAEEFWEEFWEEIHEASSNFMLLLIALHIAGVMIASRLYRENLVRAMVTGKKEAPSTD